MHDDEIRAAAQSLDARIWFHTVGVTNTNRVEIPGGDTETTGTGSLLCRHGHRFVLTAKHVLDEADPGDLRIFFPNAPLTTAANIDELRWGPAYRGDPGAGFTIERSPSEDIALIRDENNFGSLSSEFHDLTTYLDPPEGRYVSTIGFPLHGRFSLAVERSGNRETHAEALAPAVWEAAVLGTMNALLEGFDPDNHYLVDHQASSPDRTPHGYSGAAMWYQSREPTIVWHPVIVFCGVCTHYYRRRNVERVVKASTVVRFIDDVLGIPASR